VLVVEDEARMAGIVSRTDVLAVFDSAVVHLAARQP